MADLILQVVDKIGNKKVLSVLTDNAAAMIKARKLIKLKYNHIAVYGCLSHGYNLLIGDIMNIKTLQSLKTQANKIANEINLLHK